MALFWNTIIMFLPFYIKCKTCKYYHGICSKDAKCRHFINLTEPFVIEEPNKFYCENDLYLDIESCRKDEGLCGIDGKYYERRLK